MASYFKTFFYFLLVLVISPSLFMGAESDHSYTKNELHSIVENQNKYHYWRSLGNKFEKEGQFNEAGSGHLNNYSCFGK